MQISKRTTKTEGNEAHRIHIAYIATVAESFQESR